MTLSRKDFLKLAGGSVGAAVALKLLPGTVALAGAGDRLVEPNPNAKGALYDNTICIGCRSCEQACKKVNGLPPDKENPEKLTSDTFTRIRTTQADVGGTVKPVFIKLQCMHCQHPACAEACIVGALKKTPEGPVTYDESKCIGCRYCMVACPFGIPTFQWDEAVPWIRKCTFCAERQAQGQPPACVEACPVKALKSGTRADLLAEAQARIQASPAKYVNQVYGQNEVGGTSWLYLSAVPFEKLGFKPHIQEPVTINAARAMGLVPPVLLGVGAMMSGVYWLTKRKEALNPAKVHVENPVQDKKGGEDK